MRKETMIITPTTQPIVERLDLVTSDFIDDRLRGYYFFPIDWFVTGQLCEDDTGDTEGIFVKKAPAFGQRVWKDSLVMHVYLPFEFEGYPVVLIS